MTHSPATHGSFTLERVYRCSQRRAFDAFARAELKAIWFSGPPEDWKELERSHDFRVGGIEIAEGRFTASGVVSRYVARFHEIIDGHRIVSAYEMRLNGNLHSLSLATVELCEASGGTRLVYTEQIVFLDGTTAEGGTRSRESGTVALFDRLERSLEVSPA